jgi:hypothetical protein
LCQRFATFDAKRGDLFKGVFVVHALVVLLNRTTCQ